MLGIVKVTLCTYVRISTIFFSETCDETWYQHRKKHSGGFRGEGVPEVPCNPPFWLASVVLARQAIASYPGHSQLFNVGTRPGKLWNPPSPLQASKNANGLVSFSSHLSDTRVITDGLATLRQMEGF